MIKYYFEDRQKNGYISIKKNYIINIEKYDKNIILKKEECENNFDEQTRPFRSLKGQLTALDISRELANVKNIGFEVTDSCNLNCTYCIYGNYYDNHDPRLNKKIDTNKAKLLIDYIVCRFNSLDNFSFKNDVYISFYGGEPLLNIDFIKEIVSYTRNKEDKNLRFKYQMTTNGVYLKKYIDYIVDNNIFLTISLDGSETNDAYRRFRNGKSSFNSVFKTLKFIQNRYSDFFKKCVKFNSVLHNLNNYQEAFSFIYNEFGKIPNFSTLNRTGVKTKSNDEFEIMYKQREINCGEKLKEMEIILDLETNSANQFQSFVFNYSGNIYENYNDLLEEDSNVEYLPTGTCIPFSRRIFMTVNNKIFPCERIGHQYFLGEVTDNEVLIDYEKIANTYNSYYKSISVLCSKCFRNKHCLLCLFSVNNILDNPICDQMMNKEEFEDYILKNMQIISKNYSLYRRIMNEILLFK